MRILTIIISFVFVLNTNGQNIEDLLDMAIADQANTEIVNTTFKSVQLINAHTTKMPAQKELIFLISHRFGYLTSGFPDLYGLDNATARFGFEYGINEKIALGFGRSTYKSNYDIFGKFALLQQKTGTNAFPFTLTLIGVSNISSARWPSDNREYLFAHRISYTAQLLLSRKFNEAFSFQLMPTFIHYNLVKTANQANSSVALGAGGRVKLSNRIALTAEYHYSFSNSVINQPLSIGVDIETGGHVFQLFFTNTSAIYDNAIITETTDSWLDGNIRFGFNISRTF
ncbi:MAG: hypothetical protein JW735_14440 [Prolixibacteraceae bacterium]|nr:hypothetical protein [Prolixibacteraceae bacterium]